MDPSNLGHTYPTHLSKSDVALNSPSRRLVNNINHRYSPMRNTSPKLFSSQPSRPVTNHTFTGPLLTSMNLNSNLSTYLDSKSPGLAERIVQYRNESQQQQSQQKPCLTHQPKYRGPGQFPIVHLLKKDIPVRNIPPHHKVTVRLAPSDAYPALYSSRMDYCNSRENMIRRRIMSSNDISKSEEVLQTQNVLEALRNISRKRIHTDEPFSNSTLSAKRACHESITGSSEGGSEDEGGSSTTAASSSGTAGISTARNVYCVDPITASLTSSHPNLIPCYEDKIKRRNREKSKSIQRRPPIRQSTAETQTDVIPKPVIESTTLSENNIAKEVTTRRKSVDIPQRNNDLALSEEAEDDATVSNGLVINNKNRIFDTKPFETIKKNKLAKFLSILGNNAEEDEAIVPPVADSTNKPKLSLEQQQKELNPEINNSQLTPAKVITSIISPENKPKHNKHVTFNLPTVNASKDDSIMGNGEIKLSSPNGASGDDSKSDKNNDEGVSSPKPALIFGQPVNNTSQLSQNEKKNSSFKTVLPPISSNAEVLASSTPVFGIPTVSSSPATSSFSNLTATTTNTIGSPNLFGISNSSSISNNNAFTAFNKTLSVSTAPSSVPLFGSTVVSSSISSAPIIFGTSIPTSTIANTAASIFATSTTSTLTAPAVQPSAFSAPSSIFNSSSVTTISATPAALISTTTSPPKVGGFKFDFKSPSTNKLPSTLFTSTPLNTTASVSVLTSTTRSSMASVTAALPSFAFGAPFSSSPPSNSFSNPLTPIKFGQNTSVSSSSNKENVIFSTGMGMKSIESKPFASQPNPFEAAAPTSVFGQPKTSLAFGASSSTNPSSIVVPQVTANNLGSGFPSSSASSNPLPTSSTFTPFFNNSGKTTSNVFGAAATSNNIFATVTTAPNLTNNFQTPSSSPFGGTVPVNNNNNLPGIPFGAPVVQPALPVFGTSKNESVVDSGNSAGNTAFKFGGGNFGEQQTGPTNNNAFGGSAAAANKVFAFGETIKNTVTTTPSFLPSATSKPQLDIFKFGNTASNNAAVTAPVNNINATNTMNAFSSTNAPNVPQTDLFKFGAQNANSQNPGGLLHQQNPPPAFNSTIPAFGGDKSSVTENKFGMSTAFSKPSSASLFGTSGSGGNSVSAPSPFNSVPVSSSNSTPSLFTFGAASAPSNVAPNINPFNNNAAPPQPSASLTSFNASSAPNTNNANNASNNIFGSIQSANVFQPNTTPNFGSPAIPNFNGNAAGVGPPFGTGQMPPGGGMFSIGSGGSSTPRSRTVIKARRRM